MAEPELSGSRYIRSTQIERFDIRLAQISNCRPGNSRGSRRLQQEKVEKTAFGIRQVSVFSVSVFSVSGVKVFVVSYKHGHLRNSSLL